MLGVVLVISFIESRIHVCTKIVWAFFKNYSEIHHLEKKRVITSKNADNNFIGFSVLYLHTRYHFHGFGQNVSFSCFFGQGYQKNRNLECKQKLNCV
jgi:hypothetical protein